jgi:hypothetical protein
MAKAWLQRTAASIPNQIEIAHTQEWAGRPHQAASSLK